jgi:hypothetical protein
MTTAIAQPKPAGVTAKVAAACQALVFDGLDLQQAAAKAGLTTRALRFALQKPGVLAHVRKQRAVLLASMSGANVRALVEVRDQQDNQMARVRAVQALEQIPDENAKHGSILQSPGVTIQIVAAPTRPVSDKAGVAIEVTKPKPLPPPFEAPGG